MSSDNSLSVIPLRTTVLAAPLLSYELSEILRDTVARKKKILILYNRRGSGRAWICRDCAYIATCPQCDIALAYHTSPVRRLMCHQCNYITPVPHTCPKCHGNGFDPIGIGIQRLESDILRLFPEIRIMRLDSDLDKKKSEVIRLLEEVDIILSTYSSIGVIHDPAIETVVFALFESDLTIPEYRMEEDLYHTLHYAKNSGKNVVIQTELASHPLLSVLLEGNYKDFLTYMSQERKQFGYPPYGDFVMLRIHDPSKARVQDIVAKLVNKIQILKKDSTFLAFDRDIWERYRNEWIQKIVLKDTSLAYLIEQLEVEIIKNRAVTLEWK